MRMLLLEAAITHRLSGDTSGVDALVAYMDGRDNAAFIMHYPGEMLSVARIESAESEAAIAGAIGQLLPRNPYADRLTYAVYEHLNRMSDIGSAPELAEAIRSSEALAGGICNLLHDDEQVAGAVDKNRQSLEDFCTSLLP
jgi:hypothetical protein